MYKFFLISGLPTILNNPVEYLKGVTALRADLLHKELAIFNFNDLLHFFPFRHIDKTKLDTIASLSPANEYAQVAGKLIHFGTIGDKRGKRLIATLKDDTGEIELIWFQGINWIQKSLSIGQQYMLMAA